MWQIPLDVEKLEDSRDCSRCPCPLPFDVSCPLPFAAFSHARNRIRIDRSARKRFALQFSCPFHAVTRQHAVNTVSKPCQIAPLLVFARPVKSHNVELQLFGVSDFGKEGLPQHNLQNSD